MIIDCLRSQNQLAAGQKWALSLLIEPKVLCQLLPHIQKKYIDFFNCNLENEHAKPCRVPQ